MGIKNIRINTIQVEVICADMERFVANLIRQGIQITDMNLTDDITGVINVQAKSTELIKKCAMKYGAEIKIHNNSIPARLIRFVRSRPVLLIGLLAMLILSIYISRTVLFVQVIGNEAVSAFRILDEAENCGLNFGSSRSEINSELIKNSILENIPQLQWIGVNTSGCVATISIKERTETQESSVYSGPSSIVASKDGIISSVTSVKGASQCQIGKAVNQGDILISPYIDYGNVTVISGAEGEVYANTINEIHVVSLRKVNTRTQTNSPKIRLSIILRKKLINLYKCSGILDGSCVKMYSENNICLPGGFKLPIKICVEQIWDSETQFQSIDQALWPVESGRAYMLDRMNSGRILEQHLTESNTDELFIYDLKLFCCEMIGKTKKEEIFIFNGKDN